MKKHIKLLTIGTLLLTGLTGCNDFLDREPLDKVIPENILHLRVIWLHTLSMLTHLKQ